MIGAMLRRLKRTERAISRRSAELEDLEYRLIVLLADLWHRVRQQGGTDMSDPTTKTRILISHDQTISITGTQDQIENAARRFARRTRSCVVITVPVAHYHVRGCGENPRGGYVEEGN